MNFLGLDIGTSAVKAVLVDSEGRQITETSAGLDVQRPQSGWSEQYPDSWVSTTEHCCTTLKRDSASAWGAVGAIGLSGQMHGAALLDKQGVPLRPAILWNDSRSTAECDTLNAAIDDIETRAGIIAMPGFTAPKVMWCAKKEPKIYGKIAHILLPKDYVRLFLTGEFATDMADAAGTMWLNQKRRRWDSKLCAASRTDISWLPDLVEGTAISGRLRPKIAAQLGLPPGIPVSGGGGDAAAGALGIGAIGDGDAFASLGTSGQLFVSTDVYRPAPGAKAHSYAHCVPDRWFQMACMLNGASPLDWFAKLANRPIADLLVEAEKAADAPLFLPYLTGERTPHNDAAIRASFYGLQPQTSDADCMRGVVEAIAYSFCDAQECLRGAGTELDQIAVIGGGSRSDFLLQTMSNAMDLPIHRYKDSATGPALGAARTAMVAGGGHDLASLATRPCLDRTFEPEASAANYHAQKLERWKSLYQTLKPFAHEVLEEMPA